MPAPNRLLNGLRNKVLLGALLALIAGAGLFKAGTLYGRAPETFTGTITVINVHRDQGCVRDQAGEETCGAILKSGASASRELLVVGALVDVEAAFVGLRDERLTLLVLAPCTTGQDSGLPACQH